MILTFEVFYARREMDHRNIQKNEERISGKILSLHSLDSLQMCISEKEKKILIYTKYTQTLYIFE